ncbi:MAG: sulfatase-like hydrolase/transferase [Bacteroidales bacterium]|nr:sulfatase-like hydrolase/transferase [Bacteroidales bacterium]MDD4214915.1 sulfatase-like hydrolase/transferase [Bacteroidales bacterium]
MKKTSFSEIKFPIWYFLKLFIFWMLLFEAERIIFLLFNYKDLLGIPFSQIMLSFFYALGSDISASCYLMILPFLIITTGMFTNKSEAFFAVAKWANYLLIILYLSISFAGIALYNNWGTKVNSKALSFITYPKEIFEIIFNISNLLYFALMVAVILPVILLFKRIFKRQQPVKPGILAILIFLIVFSGLMFTGVRGGIQKQPINKSWCFYSGHSILNFAALNDLWNITSILSHPQIKTNPYTYFREAEFEKTIEELYKTEKDTTELLCTSTRPNIVLIILESFSADAVACLGGEKGIAPNFDSLAQKGLLFTEFYATGFRTDQGIVALLSSFAAQPRTSIINNYEKFDKLPNFITTLRKNGYYTSLYFGGDPAYAEMESYLQVSGIDLLIREGDIPHTHRTDWGAYDEDVFNFQLHDLKNSKEPFFSIMLSLTNHEYFEADVPKIYQGKDQCTLFRNTAHYTDKCLYDFLKASEKEPWYNNTLFIITADHAHRCPLERTYNEPLRHHIPFLFYGNALKEQYRGKTINKTGSHLDLTATLLAQLNIVNYDFEWSKNLMNKYAQGFAFYVFDDGFGFITDSADIVYDHNLKAAVTKKMKIEGADTEKALRQGKAFLQKTFQEYIKL